MITHALYYRPIKSKCSYVKLFHSLQDAEKMAVANQRYTTCWEIRKITGVLPETGQACLETVKYWEKEE